MRKGGFGNRVSGDKSMMRFMSFSSPGKETNSVEAKMMLIVRGGDKPPQSLAYCQPCLSECSYPSQSFTLSTL